MLMRYPDEAVIIKEPRTSLNGSANYQSPINDLFDKWYLFCTIIDNRAAALSIVIATRSNSFSFRAM